MAAALVEAAEQIAETEGAAAVSVRRVADEVGTTTRAVYSVFGSKDALIGALGCRGFDWLGSAVAGLPLTDDPVADLVEAGASAFRRFVVERPVLFQIGVQLTWPEPVRQTIADAANAAWQHLIVRTDRLAAADLVGLRTSQQAAVEFHAMCEGLAALETRGLLQVISTERDPATVWRQGLGALVSGFSIV